MAELREREPRGAPDGALGGVRGLMAKAGNMIRGMVLLLLFMVPAVQAQEAGVSDSGLTASEAVDQYVGELLERLIEIQEYYNTDRERYFTEVEQALAEFVDFREAARGVMAKYSAGPRGANEEQLDRFAEVFRSSIVEFYGTALAQYNGQGYNILDSNEASGDTATVGMTLEGDDDERFELRYAVYLNDEGEWRVRNLFVEGINMRRQYHSQFDSLMAEHDYDIDAAIENWDPEPVQ